MHESKPLSSKKFLAYLLAETTWKVALLVVLVMGMKNGTIDLIVGSIALAIVLVAGFVESGFIIGQAALDKYVRVAQIASESGKSITLKGMQVGSPTDVAPPPPTPTPRKKNPPPADG